MGAFYPPMLTLLLTGGQNVPPIIGLSALAVEAYGFTLGRVFVRPSVCARRDIWRSAHQILMIFCTKLHLDESKKIFQGDL